MKIVKLKILEIKLQRLIVEDSQNEVGYIHISKCAYRFIEDLNLYFEVGDLIYAEKINKDKKEYSLIGGHSMNETSIKDKKIIESGGGFNILEHQLNKLEKEYLGEK